MQEYTRSLQSLPNKKRSYLGLNQERDRHESIYKNN